MPTIELITTIHAPIDRCFDLARSIDLHKASTKETKEQAIAGVTSGLIGKDEMVQWKAKHFGITQTLTSRITQFERPYHFQDEMTQGAFKMIKHDHLFEEVRDNTIMRDEFIFESPGGIFGIVANKLILEKYLRSLLVKRNEVIKNVAESEQWKSFLKI